MLLPIFLALSTKPLFPNFDGIKTISAPKALINFILSCDIFSGITKINLYPFAAHMETRPIPVFPMAGSITTLSLWSFPFFLHLLS